MTITRFDILKADSEFLSTTAFATPSALSATQFTAFASAVDGATLMGFGTTNDVALKNRAGTTALRVIANSVNVDVAGVLSTAGVSNTGTSAGDVIIPNNRFLRTRTAAGVLQAVVGLSSSDFLLLGGGGPIQWMDPAIADGTGGSATIGHVGGSGRPATAAQNKWLRVLDNTGTACYIPVWQ